MTVDIDEPRLVLQSDETGAVALFLQRPAGDIVPVSVQSGTWDERVSLMDRVGKKPGDLLQVELSQGRLSGRVRVQPLCPRL